MAIDEQKISSEPAKKGSIIDSIGVSLERFKGSLSDDRKVKLFAMSPTRLKKLATDISNARTSQSAISLIVAAIAASQDEKRREQAE